jgi:phage protein D
LATERRIPVCKVSVGGSPMEVGDQARLVRARVELDSNLLAETHLLFMDPELALINGAVFDSGKPVALKMGFGSSAGDVFTGEVVRLEPQFRRDQPVSLMVVAQDSLHRLALKQNTRAFNDADASDVLTAVAQENGLSADAPSGTKGHILQNNLTDAEFLKRIASRMGLTLKLEDKKLSMSATASASAIQLSLADGVKKIKVKRKAQGQVATVTVHGWDEKNKQEVTGTAQPQGPTGKGAQDYGKGTLSDTSGDLLPIDVSSAEEMAKGRMKKIAEGFTVLSAEMIGDARLVPGASVEFDKLGAGCDGKYRIERARHEFSKQGYFVKFDAVWTGPKDPPPAAAAPAPKPYTPPKPVANGRLTRPRWKRRTQGDQDTADLAVDATRPLEGKSVTFILESKVSGQWKEVAKANGTVSKGVATANAPLAPIAAADALSAPKWTQAKDARHQHGESADVSVACKLKDPTDVRIVFEQQLIGGRLWEELDAKLVKTSGGEAKASFDIEHPHGAEAGTAHDQLLRSPAWSKKPGGEARTDGILSVEAPGLAEGRKVNLIVERLGRDGKWTALKTVEAKVEKGVAQAAVDLAHSSTKPQPDDAQVLASPKWEKGDLAHGDLGKLSVAAPKLDGRQVRLVVECNDGGEWVAVGEKLVKVAGGKAEAHIPLLHPASGDDAPDLAAAAFDPATGFATVAAPGLDGRTVRFTLERQRSGKWNVSGAMTALVKGGMASAKLAAPVTGKLTAPAWDNDTLTHGDVVQVSVAAAGLDGEQVEFALERLRDGAWTAAGVEQARVAQGKAVASFTVQNDDAANASDLAAGRLRFRARLADDGGALRVKAELVSGLEAKKFRFRAIVVPDLGKQKLRFRAEPVPDLRPRKIRFRAELPVPEDPSLTRLTVKLVGGTDDDSVSTGAGAGN